MNAYITKPVDPRQLLDVLRRYLAPGWKESAGAEALAQAPPFEKML
jgi:DNA-binding response OmpR family regulator